MKKMFFVEVRVRRQSRDADFLDLMWFLNKIIELADIILLFGEIGSKTMRQRTYSLPTSKGHIEVSKGTYLAYNKRKQ